MPKTFFPILIPQQPKFCFGFCRVLLAVRHPSWKERFFGLRPAVAASLRPSAINEANTAAELVAAKRGKLRMEINSPGLGIGRGANNRARWKWDFESLLFIFELIKWASKGKYPNSSNPALAFHIKGGGTARFSSSKHSNVAAHSL